jgi:hypothetical protein
MYGGYGIDGAGVSQILDDLWSFDPTLGAYGEWAWMGGHALATPVRPGAYGPKYAAADANWPGARTGAGSWTDKQGRLWLFGGYGPDASGVVGFFNDLWVFDPALGAHGQWAWISGSKTIPSCSYCGNPGVYGTQGQFDATNVPGSRDIPVCWTDASGRMWFYSGIGFDSSPTFFFADLEDIWVFDPAQGDHGEWAWMGGPNTGVEWDAIGSYGSEFQPAPENIPSYHQAPSHWNDADGSLWLFGGFGSDSAGVNAPLNDVWNFDPTAGSGGEWAWAGGDNTITYFGRRGNYPGQKAKVGPKYHFGDDFLPGARSFSLNWTDAKNRHWLLAGDGIGPFGCHGYLSDLWVFDPALGTHGQWAWMAGDATIPCDETGGHSRGGTYGTKYKFDPANAPGSRTSGQTWTDANGNLWMFASWGADSAGNVAALRDLWEFRFFTTQTVSFTPPLTRVAFGHAPVRLSATASSGLPVTFQLLAGPATLSGPHNQILTFTGPGKVVVAATQPGDDKYSPAPEVKVWIAVTGGA